MVADKNSLRDDVFSRNTKKLSLLNYNPECSSRRRSANEVDEERERSVVSLVNRCTLALPATTLTLRFGVLRLAVNPLGRVW